MRREQRKRNMRGERTIRLILLHYSYNTVAENTVFTMIVWGNSVK